jgi:hypothetical protein
MPVGPQRLGDLVHEVDLHPERVPEGPEARPLVGVLQPAVALARPAADVLLALRRRAFDDGHEQRVVRNLVGAADVEPRRIAVRHHVGVPDGGAVRLGEEDVVRKQELRSPPVLR